MLLGQALRPIGMAACEHKAIIGCYLTALPVCCSCADKRPQSTQGYPEYVDGVGLTNNGWRWTKYCSKCRDHWHDEEVRAPSSLPPPGLSWLSSPRRLPVTARPSPPGVRARGRRQSQPTPTDAPRPFPPNPFGTREELESEDWESPISTMMTRAYARYRDSENNRRQIEYDLQTGSLASASANNDISHIHSVARDIAAEVLSQYPAELRTPSPARPNPIDHQPRPAGLSGSEMVVNIACRICEEQRIDTLMEPCMHAAMCHWCSDLIRTNAQNNRRRRRAGFGDLTDSGPQEWKCPICRHEVTGVRRIYLC